MVGLRIAFVSDIGRVRQNNEDAAGAVVLDEGTRVGVVRAAFVVADGMGGHEQGEVASRLAVDTVLDRVPPGTAVDPSQTSSAQLLIDAMNQAHHTIRGASGNEEGAGMGTTAIAGIVVDDILTLAHVGDSRAYLARRDEIRQLTDDHAWAAQQVREGLITPDAAAVHPMRHYLTRSLGQQSKLELDIVEHDPMQEGDVVVVCTDGLTNHVNDDEILACLHATREPQQAAELMTTLAKTRGGSDNVTVLVLECGRLRRSRAFAYARGIVVGQRRARPKHVGWAIVVVLFALGALGGVGYHRGWLKWPGQQGAAPAADGSGGTK